MMLKTASAVNSHKRATEGIADHLGIRRPGPANGMAHRPARPPNGFRFVIIS